MRSSTSSFRTRTKAWIPVSGPGTDQLAAGAMIFVVSHEVVLETHRDGHQTPATISLIVGFALMMVLDTTLG